MCKPPTVHPARLQQEALVHKAGLWHSAEAFICRYKMLSLETTPTTGQRWTPKMIYGRGRQDDAPGCCEAARGPSVGWQSLWGCLSGDGAGAERTLGCCVLLIASVQTALHIISTPSSHNSASGQRHFSTCINSSKSPHVLEGVDHGGIRKKARPGCIRKT